MSDTKREHIGCVEDADSTFCDSDACWCGVPPPSPVAPAPVTDEQVGHCMELVYDEDGIQFTGPKWVAAFTVRLNNLLAALAPVAPAPTDVESLSAKFHEIYMIEARRQGDVRHKDAYADLPENIKEFDRVLARYVLGLLAPVTKGETGQDAYFESPIEKTILGLSWIPLSIRHDVIRAIHGHLVAAQPAGTPHVRDEQIKYMVSRFLSWRLPENFNPDGGISFKRMRNEQTSFPAKNEPVGTNLLDATQAEEMIRYLIDDLPAPHASGAAPQLPPLTVSDSSLSGQSIQVTAALAAPATGKLRELLGEFVEFSMNYERSSEWCNPPSADYYDDLLVRVRAALAAADEEGGARRGLKYLARCPECHSADIIATGDATFPWECCACDGHMRFSTPYVSAAAPPLRERETQEPRK